MLFDDMYFLFLAETCMICVNGFSEISAWSDRRQKIPHRTSL